MEIALLIVVLLLFLCWYSIYRARACLKKELEDERQKHRAADQELAAFVEILQKRQALEIYHAQESMREWAPEHPVEPGVYLAAIVQKQATGIGPLKSVAVYYIVCLRGEEPCMTSTVHRISGTGNSEHPVLSDSAEKTRAMTHWMPLLKLMKRLKD